MTPPRASPGSSTLMGTMPSAVARFTVLCAAAAISSPHPAWSRVAPRDPERDTIRAKSRGEPTALSSPEQGGALVSEARSAGAVPLANAILEISHRLLWQTDA